ncbi:MAG TPA: tail fiber protein [Candidatus Sulfotelmatobacter sp.]|nr:tail fiber protein [Candidatus Sulfotelmatobacter sp.]
MYYPPYIATIGMFAGNFAVYGWQLCNGQTLAIQTNTALFSVIGTYYGGNGVNTFQLPNMQSRFPIHQGTGLGLSTYVIGQAGGSENVGLSLNNLPRHNHLVNAVSSLSNQITPTNHLPGAEQNGQKPEIYSNAATNTTMKPTMLGNAGGNVPFGIQQPYLCISFEIALVGIFPSRN